jgi:hypothetical protein
MVLVSMPNGFLDSALLREIINLADPKILILNPNAHL